MEINKIEVGVDLATKVKKFNEYIKEENTLNIDDSIKDKLKHSAMNIGLDLTKNLSKRIEL